MPRREGPKAEAAAKKARESRWRYLLRNPEFRAELNELRRSKGRGRGKVFNEPLTDFLVKWDLLWVPSEILDSESGIPDLGPVTIEVYEPFFQFPVRKPVTAIDLFDAYPDRIVCTCDAEDLGSPPRGVLLEILVDLRYPRDVIISLIEQELRKAQKRPRPQQRQHLDKVDFHLKVYDLAEQGDTFAAIANTLGKPKSTVKSAFIAVRRNIFGSAPVHSKKRLPLVDFNLNRHLMECSVCKAAEQFEDMCPQARAYALQEYKSQREVIGLDTLRGIDMDLGKKRKKPRQVPPA